MCSDDGSAFVRAFKQFFCSTETTALSVEPGPSTSNNEADRNEKIESIIKQRKRSEEEIEEAINQAEKIENEFVNVVKRSKKSTPHEFSCQFTIEDEEAECIFRNHEGSPFLDFEIELEKTKCPRFACACHTSYQIGYCKTLQGFQNVKNSFCLRGFE